jgi:large subunit ribosomal protein L28
MKQADKQPEKGKLQCAICGKGVQHVNLVSFSKRRIKHIRKPNLHVHHLVIEGTRVKIKVCTTCKRSLRQAQRAEQVATAKVSA